MLIAVRRLNHGSAACPSLGARKPASVEKQSLEGGPEAVESTPTPSTRKKTRLFTRERKTGRFGAPLKSPPPTPRHGRRTQLLGPTSAWASRSTLRRFRTIRKTKAKSEWKALPPQRLSPPRTTSLPVGRMEGRSTGTRLGIFRHGSFRRSTNIVIIPSVGLRETLRQAFRGVDAVRGWMTRPVQKPTHFKRILALVGSIGREERLANFYRLHQARRGARRLIPHFLRQTVGRRRTTQACQGSGRVQH